MLPDAKAPANRDRGGSAAVLCAEADPDAGAQRDERLADRLMLRVKLEVSAQSARLESSPVPRDAQRDVAE